MATAAGKVSAPIRSIRAVPHPSVRADADACPGALRLHAAADGPLARVRVPGGRMTGAQLRAVHDLAASWGDGHVELTSRANLQLRALRDAPVAELAARLQAAGLLPSPTHELVRNTVASPLAGGLPVEALDRALCADESLAGLPGRFLFALDGGAGDVAFGADVAALPVGDELAIIFAGVDAGLRVPTGEAVPALLAGAHAFLAERAAQQSASPLSTEGAATQPTERLFTQTAEEPLTQTAEGPLTQTAEGPLTQTAEGPLTQTTEGPLTQTTEEPFTQAAGGRQRVAWRVRELADGPVRVAARTAASLGRTLGEPVRLTRPAVREPIGIIEQPGGAVAVGVVVPLGRLSDGQLTTLEAAESLIFTPWRGVVLPGLAPQAARSWLVALAAVGLEVAAGSRWLGVTACAGRPGCAKSLADVRADADAATVAGEGLPVHWVGCPRGCGSPAGPHVRVEATGTGYEVRSPHAGGFSSVGAVGALVSAARKG